MRASYCTTPPQPLDSPMTSFKLPSTNIFILTSLHPLLGFLSSRSVYFRPLSLRPPCGSSALQECLHCSNPLINSLLSQSHLIFIYSLPIFFLHLLPFSPISHQFFSHSSSLLFQLMQVQTIVNFNQIDPKATVKSFSYLFLILLLIPN